MASLADSQAHFLARAKEYSVPDDLIDNMKVAGVSTMAHLAFAFVRPGQDFDQDKFDQWAKTVNLGVAPTLGVPSVLQGLMQSESSSQVLALMVCMSLHRHCSMNVFLNMTCEH